MSFLDTLFGDGPKVPDVLKPSDLLTADQHYGFMASWEGTGFPLPSMHNFRDALEYDGFDVIEVSENEHGFILDIEPQSHGRTVADVQLVAAKMGGRSIVFKEPFTPGFEAMLDVIDKVHAGLDTVANPFSFPPKIEGNPELGKLSRYGLLCVFDDPKYQRPGMSAVVANLEKLGCDCLEIGEVKSYILLEIEPQKAGVHAADVRKVITDMHGVPHLFSGEVFGVMPEKLKDFAEGIQQAADDLAELPKKANKAIRIVLGVLVVCAVLLITWAVWPRRKQ